MPLLSPRATARRNRSASRGLIGLIVVESYGAYNTNRSRLRLAGSLAAELVLHIDDIHDPRLMTQAWLADSLVMGPVELSPSPAWLSALNGGALHNLDYRTVDLLSLAYDRFEKYRSIVNTTPTFTMPLAPAPSDTPAATTRYDEVLRAHHQPRGAAIAATLWALAGMRYYEGIEIPGASFEIVPYGESKDLLWPEKIVTFRLATTHTDTIQVRGPWPARCERWSFCPDNPRELSCAAGCTRGR
jgi:hypothetical protein